MFDWTSVRTFSKEDELSLRSLFQICVRAHANLDKLPRSTDEAQDVLNCVTDIACHCAGRVESLGLFSANEDADDLSTASLRYILVGFFAAEGYADTRERLPRVRLQELHEAIKWYKCFLTMCEQYDLVHPSAATSVRRINHAEEVSDHAARNSKIEQRRQERAIREKVVGLMAALNISELADVPEDLDDETERELWRASVHAACIKSVHAVEMIRQEMTLLKMKAQKESGDDHMPDIPQDSAAEHDQRRDDMRGTLFQIARDLSSKQQKAKAVFKPSHILPTITVEEAGLLELEEMRLREEREIQHELQAQIRISSMTQDEQEDEKLMQQRSLDDWKDEHPTGYGNSKLRPCAL